MKKTLATVAVLGAFAGSALADVTIYGVHCTGFWYETQNDTFKMSSGDLMGSRLGFKGSEKISDDLTVGFILEAGFNTDTGELLDSNRFFYRESSVYVDTPYGKLAFGRLGTITQDLGSFGKFAPYASMLGTGCAGVMGLGMFTFADTFWDNMIAYQTPRKGGLQGYLQYSMGDGENENESIGNNRYAAIGADYEHGGLKVGFTAEQVNKAGELNADDMYNVNLAANYNFGNGVIATVAGQYFQDAKFDYNVGGIGGAGQDGEGFSVNTSALFPFAAGQLTVGATYTETESKANDLDRTAYNFGAFYSYNFSKNFLVYTTVAYNYEEVKTANDKNDDNWVTVAGGVVLLF